MKIVNYLASLLPSFDRQRITTHIASMQSDLGSGTLKVYRDAASLYSKHPFKSKFNVDFEKLYRNKLKGIKAKTYVEGICTILSTLPDKLALMDSLVSSNFSKDVQKDGLTYKKVNVLKYLDVCDFAVTYADRLLLYSMASETYHNTGAESELSEDFVPAMSKWIMSNEVNFLDALKVLELPVREVKEKLESVPDVTAAPDPDKAQMAKSMVGESKLDPIGLGFLITTWGNPIYKLRMTLAEWQVARYKAKQEEKRALEYRLLALEESYDKKTDPKLKQTIDYTQGRLKRLNHRLAEIEADAGVA